jgi:hypothetical protein
MNKYQIDIAERVASLSENLPFIKGLSNIELALLTVSILFCIATFVINTYILLRRYYINNRQTQVKALIEKYETLLIEYIYTTKNERIALLESIKPHNKLDSSILLAQIILMKKNLKGHEAFVLIDLYEKLGFYKVSFKKLHSLSWVKRYEGLQELAYMHALKMRLILFKLLKDKSSIVRIATLKALIMNNMNWQKVLKNYEYPLSKWEQVQICETIYTTSTISLRDCLPLLESRNQTVVALVGLCEKLFTQLNSQELSSINQTQVIASFMEKELVLLS